MKFRLKAFGLHLSASTVVLTTVVGTLYGGWYRWPGWYLTDAVTVVLVLAGVDLAVGPLLTLVVAGPNKPRAALRRDIAIIVAVQVIALLYGTVSLWRGRPLYYAYSETVLELVQAYDIKAEEAALGRRDNASLAPHWYSLPRWIWAPLPLDPNERARIIGSAISGGDDVIAMPRYYQPWVAGLPTLRQELKKADDVPYFARSQKAALKEAMRATGLAAEAPNAMSLTGRGPPMLAVFDPATLRLSALCMLRGHRVPEAVCRPN
jgi:hypothetical protein